eukprot:33678-Eustigmatos_ZCMA.PRE.1
MCTSGVRPEQPRGLQSSWRSTLRSMVSVCTAIQPLTRGSRCGVVWRMWRSDMRFEVGESVSHDACVRLGCTVVHSIAVSYPPLPISLSRRCGQRLEYLVRRSDGAVPYVPVPYVAH